MAQFGQWSSDQTFSVNFEQLRLITFLPRLNIVGSKSFILVNKDQNRLLSLKTYSKLVLQQLETMSHGIEGLRAELQDMKNQLTELKAKEKFVLSTIDGISSSAKHAGL